MNCLSLYERLCLEALGDIPAIGAIEPERVRPFLERLIYCRTVDQAIAQMRANPEETRGLLYALRLQAVRDERGQTEPLSDEQLSQASITLRPLADCCGQFLDALDYFRKA
jgi:hypothetical protein